MSFWVQHGYGKGDKIARLVADGHVSGGVILSPADEEDGTLSATAEDLRTKGVRCLLDPQFYVHSIQGAQGRCHTSNGLELGELSWFVSPREMEEHVEAVITANNRLGLEEIIAPGPYLASFNDVWAPVGLQYSRAILDASGGRVFVSVVAEDAAFSDWDATARWLEALTTIDAHGIYLIVSHAGRTYPFAWEPNRLAGVLRVIYALGQLNQYEVVWGYSDVPGILGLCAGAAGLGTGWYYSLRMWTPQKWIPQSGGRQASPRVFLPPVLSPFDAAGEASSAARTDGAAALFADDVLLEQFLRADPGWGITDAWIQHMMGLATVVAALDAARPVPERVAAADGLLSNAEGLLRRAVEAGAALAPAHETRIAALRRGLALFIESEGL